MVAMTAVLVANSSRATGNHHSVPLGGRAALMGGTGVALGSDGAAPFLNPATVVRIANRSIAFSARFFRYSEQRFQSWHRPGPVSPELGDLELGDTTARRRELRSVPDSACVFFSPGPAPDGERGNQRFGLCLGRTEQLDLSLPAMHFNRASGERRVDQALDYEVDWYRFSVGPTWALRWTKDVAIGASLFVTRTKYQHSVAVSTLIEDTSTGAAQASTYESFLAGYSWDVAPTLGVSYRANAVWTLGFSLRAPAIHTLGGFRAANVVAVETTTNSRVMSSGEGSFRAAPPLGIFAGVGAEWRTVRLEADAFFHPGQDEYMAAAFDQTDISIADGSVTERTTTKARAVESSRPVLNLGLGAEWFVARRVSVLSGVQTDVNALSELDEVSDPARISRARLNYYRAGLGISSYTDYGDLVFGFRFDYGTGQLAGVNPFSTLPSAARVDYKELGVMLVIAGSVNWGSITQAADHVEDVVDGEAPPPPNRPIDPMRLAPKR